MSDQAEDQITAEILDWASGFQKAVEAYAKQAKRWDAGTCPICKSSLKPIDATVAGHRSPFGGTRQMQSNLQQITGYCGECLLSPAEVQDTEITKWIWMRLPDAISVNGSDVFTLRAEGSTLWEAVDDVARKHTELQPDVLKAYANAQPQPDFELSINWVPISDLQGLKTPIKGGDYVRFPPRLI